MDSAIFDFAVGSDFDFATLPSETISLTSADLDQALQLSRTCTNEAERWHAYISGLAWRGVRQWLEERFLLPTNTPPQLHQGVVCGLTVGNFKLCLLSSDGFSDRQIALPRKIVELPDTTAHFYIVVHVLEEVQLVQIGGVLRYDQLQTLIQSGDVQLDASWSYAVPLDAFDDDLDHLLLYLRCLDPAAIPLPTAAPPDLVPLLSQPVLNLGCWLQNQLDQVARSLAWVLLPPLTPVALRTTTTEIDVLMAQLSRSGMEIPSEARSGYTDLRVADAALRLYAIAWCHEAPTASGFSEWSLVLIVAAQSGYSLPLGTRLRISDATGVLLERQLHQSLPDAHLYAHVIGEGNERFVATLTCHGETLLLPTFAYQPFL